MQLHALDMCVVAIHLDNLPQAQAWVMHAYKCVFFRSPHAHMPGVQSARSSCSWFPILLITSHLQGAFRALAGWEALAWGDAGRADHADAALCRGWQVAWIKIWVDATQHVLEVALKPVGTQEHLMIYVNAVPSFGVERMHACS